MGRPSKWSGKTTPIRVPEHLAESLLELAQQMDQSFVQNKDLNVQTFDGPYLVTVDNTSYLLDPPHVIAGSNADLLEYLVDEAEKMMEGLNHSERVYLFSRLVEAWCEPVKG